jgi:8-oxo-dGTP pyrophosphatase MutT (NUDIX family)
MEYIPVPMRRLGYRVAHRILRAWWLIRKPAKQGVKCVLTHGDEVVLVRHTYGHREWDLPGGTIRRAEAPLDAAAREMHEELGVEHGDWHELDEIWVEIYHHRDTLFCFQAELATRELQVDPGEIAAARWFPLAQLPPDIGLYVRRILRLLQAQPEPATPRQPAPR